jgi:hypothetical protein
MCVQACVTVFLNGKNECVEYVMCDCMYVWLWLYSVCMGHKYVWELYV